MSNKCWKYPNGARRKGEKQAEDIKCPSWFPEDKREKIQDLCWLLHTRFAFDRCPGSRRDCLRLRLSIDKFPKLQQRSWAGQENFAQSWQLTSPGKWKALKRDPGPQSWFQKLQDSWDYMAGVWVMLAVLSKLYQLCTSTRSNTQTCLVKPPRALGTLRTALRKVSHWVTCPFECQILLN